MVESYFGIHNHTESSNLRLLDSIIKPKKLIDKAIEMGLNGVCITDHESLSSHVEANEYAQEIHKKYPNFTVGLGNEIYLTDTREKSQKYFHFLLIAKDAVGHRALRELSSTAWFYMYEDRRMERVPTLKSELKEVVKKFPGHLIATSACIGGQLGSAALEMYNAKEAGDNDKVWEKAREICSFIEYCQELFGDDFYIECAPSSNRDQVVVNYQLYKIAKVYNIKMVAGTDAHYLTKEDRWIHKAYLNSQQREREVDSFYEFARLMTYDECFSLLRNGLSIFRDVKNPDEVVRTILKNTIEIQSKITDYSLFHSQDVPKVKVKSYEKRFNMLPQYPNLSFLYKSDDVYDRYWVNQCVDKMYELNLISDDYWNELEEEARVKRIIGQKLGTNMFRYPITLQHYIDMFWDCGSFVGTGRGSSGAALNHYLLGITQLDPLKWDFPFFRYLNEERTELGDIDIDICPSKRPEILQRIKDERKSMFNDDIPQWAKDNLGCTLIATFGTEGTKSAILSSARGYRSSECPEGIDIDEAQYLSSLIPSARGILWKISDVVDGNEELGRKPIKAFVDEVNNYPGLLETIKSVEGIINHRGCHASGVILFDKDPFEHCAFMRTPSGEITTQFSLHKAETMGLVKYDFLVTEVLDKMVEAIHLMQQNNVIEKSLSIREIYNKYLHPDILPLNDEKCWEALCEGSVLDCFQFSSQVGIQAAKRLRPHSMTEMSDANGLMRLMGEENEERPIDKYYRYKNNIKLWYDEMDKNGLTKEEQKILEPYFLPSYGVPPSQESLMRMLMDPKICNFSLKDANNARKIVGKKLMSKIPELKAQVLAQAANENLGEYVWKYGIGPQMGYSFSVNEKMAHERLFVLSDGSFLHYKMANGET